MQKMLAEDGVQPIIFLPMYSDFNWWQNQNQEVGEQNATRIVSCAKDFEP